MTESEWLTSTDPAAMLAHVRPTEMVASGSGEEYERPLYSKRFYRASDRKLRLFAAACCRAVWDQLADPRSRRAVEIAERYADGEASVDELAGAWVDANGWQHQGGSPARLLCQCARDCAGEHLTKYPYTHSPAEIAVIIRGIQPAQSAAQAALLRCLFGNPWRPTSLCGSCKDCRRFNAPCADCGLIRCKNDGAVIAVARAIYAERRWGEVGVLADSLEKAGCPAEVACPSCVGVGKVYEGAPLSPPSAQLVAAWHIPCNGTGRVPNPLFAHLRSPGPHARGCWLLDCILGKD